MTDIRAISPRATPWRRKARATPFLIRQLQRLLSQAVCGDITIVLPNGETLRRQAANPGPSAKLVIRRWRTVWRLMTGGELAFADAYIAGDWWTPNLRGVSGIRRLQRHRRCSTRSPAPLRNACCAACGIGATAIPAKAAAATSRRITTSAMRSTSSGSTAACNTRRLCSRKPDQPLEAAQEEKLNRVCQLLDIAGGERVLEIGCGWGALMEKLAPQCDITGVTLVGRTTWPTPNSGWAARPSPGAPNCGCRIIATSQERYDRIVSIEMIEAVGERYWPVYFDKLRNALTPDGTVLLQAITIAEDRFDKYRQQPDFIQSYIFPGGVLPTVDIIRQQAARAGLELTTHEPFGLSYARTLAVWRERFLAAWPEIERLGFDTSFKRMWEYYLCYCEAGFRNGAIDVGFYKFKPRPA